MGDLVAYCSYRGHEYKCVCVCVCVCIKYICNRETLDFLSTSNYGLSLYELEAHIFSLVLIKFLTLQPIEGGGD